LVIKKRHTGKRAKKVLRAMWMTPNDKYGLISLLWPYILAYKSRNIEQILANCFQFDLYAGQRIFVWNPFFWLYACYTRIQRYRWNLKKSQFWTVFWLSFSIRLIRGLTYPRVYTALNFVYRIASWLILKDKHSPHYYLTSLAKYKRKTRFFFSSEKKFR
jgi:hypothetical protein